MEGLFTFLSIVIIVFCAFHLVINLIFKHKIRKLNKEFKQETFDKQQFEQQRQKGDTRKKKPRVDPKIGDYTDFEEID